jgi:ABC-type lipoprotein release transport system permease subunit
MALIGTTIGIVLAFFAIPRLALRSLRRCFDGFGHARGSFQFVACHAFVASYIPALRATQVDPVVALREQ